MVSDLILFNLGEDAMQCASLQGVMLRNRDHMDRRPFVPQPYVAALLTDHLIAEVLQCAN
jgi:hypothetical protein